MNIYRLAHKSIVGRAESAPQFFSLPTFFFLSRKESKGGVWGCPPQTKREENKIGALGQLINISDNNNCQSIKQILSFFEL